MKNQLIYIDLLFIVERLLPNKGTVSLFRSHHKNLPISTLSLEHCLTASELQFALFQHCPTYTAMLSTNQLKDELIDGNESDIYVAKTIVANFIKGSHYWVEHYLNIYNENWQKKQKAYWLRDFKLLTQAIIGIGNCKKASWFIENHSILKTLTYHEQLIPFLPNYSRAHN